MIRAVGGAPDCPKTVLGSGTVLGRPQAGFVGLRRATMRKYCATPKSYVGPPVKKEKGWRKCEKVRESVKRKVGEWLEEV